MSSSSFIEDSDDEESRESFVSDSQASMSSISYVGLLSDMGKMSEKEIVGPRGTIRGVKNRVRAGLANFENPRGMQTVSRGQGWGDSCGRRKRAYFLQYRFFQVSISHSGTTTSGRGTLFPHAQLTTHFFFFLLLTAAPEIL